MKQHTLKWITGILCAALLATLAGCGEASPQDTAPTEAAGTLTTMEEATALSTAEAGGMVDLTALSGTMVYSEVYNMVVSPEDYVGRTVKMRGTFFVYESDSRNYYSCIISDATACCSQGIEFLWAGDHSYPEDYPEPGSEIVVEGVFDTYEEGDLLYCQLIDAEVSPA